MARFIVVDTGPLLAIANRLDASHDACIAWIGSASTRDLLVPSLVVTEVCQFIEKRVGPEAEAAFIEGLMDSPQFTVYHPTERTFSAWPGWCVSVAVRKSSVVARSRCPNGGQ
jgi:predicted nucleic acid-binding protein